MSRIPVEQVSKIDFDQLVEVGTQMGFDILEVKHALNDCEIAREGDPIAVIYRGYIGKVGLWATEESRQMVRLILNRIFDAFPDMNRLFILNC